MTNKQEIADNIYNLIMDKVAMSLHPPFPMDKINIKTLLDEFAIAALTGLIARPQGAEIFNVYAEVAYKYADAMMAEKQKREEKK